MHPVRGPVEQEIKAHASTPDGSRCDGAICQCRQPLQQISRRISYSTYRRPVALVALLAFLLTIWLQKIRLSNVISHSSYIGFTI